MEDWFADEILRFEKRVKANRAETACDDFHSYGKHCPLCENCGWDEESHGA